MAPSRLLDGRLYRREVVAELAPAPAWLVDLILPEPRSRPTPSIGVERPRNSSLSGTELRRSLYLSKVLESELDRVASTPAGGHRNSVLNTASLRLGHYIGAGLLDRAYVERRLMAAAEICGTLEKRGQRQCEATIRGAIEAGAREPAVLPPELQDIRSE